MEKKKAIRLIDATALTEEIWNDLDQLKGAPCSSHDAAAYLAEMVEKMPTIRPFGESHNIGLYEQIQNPEKVRIYAQDYISTVNIMCYDLPVPLSSLKWKEERPEHAPEDVFMWLSLADIAKQTGDGRGIITVTVEGPLDGIIYRYGNHGDSWEIVGRLCGYA